MITIFHHHFFPRRGCAFDPVPPRPIIKHLLAEIAHGLDLAGCTPVDLVDCESWPARHPDGGPFDVLAGITITATPIIGSRRQKLIQWYELRHPRWHWATRSLPVIEHAPLVPAIGRQASVG